MKHNLATDRPSRELLSRVIDERGLEAVLNRRSVPYKEMDLGSKKLTKAQAIDLMLEDPNLIKRPLVLAKGKTILGYDAEEYSRF